MNSFIPWIGGKSQLRRPILQKFPKDRPKRYFEVFGGAGWILFSREKHADLEVFNDIDGHLVNLGLPEQNKKPDNHVQNEQK